jgi:hypothetical protein
MGVDGGVTSGTSQVLVLPVGNVKVGLRVSELLCETKIDDIDLVAALADAHQEVVRLDVTVNEVARVDILDKISELNEIRNKWKGLNVPVDQQGKTVLRLNLRLQKLKRSSREGPRRSMTIAL